MNSKGKRMVVRQINPSKVNLKEPASPGEKKMLLLSRRRKIYEGIRRG